MSWNSNKPWLGVIVFFLLTGSCPAQTPGDRHPRSILDYYFLLSHKYLTYLTADSCPVREAAIQIKDLDGGFLKCGLATDEVSTTLALFKKSDGSDLIAVENRSCPAACSSSLNLLLYANDHWADVTHELLPAIDGNKVQAFLQRQYMSRTNEPIRQPQLIYTLRKHGESIEVNEHWSGMVLGQFEWANDAFTFKSEEADGSNYRALAATDNLAGDRLQILSVTMADEQRKTILTLTYPIDANWKGRRDCPTFHVECFPDIDSSGAVLACMVYPSGLLPGQELTYHWNLSNGSIASGQGTRRITVNLTGTEAETMKAELEIGNLPLTCERKASFTSPIRPTGN